MFVSVLNRLLLLMYRICPDLCLCVQSVGQAAVTDVYRICPDLLFVFSVGQAAVTDVTDLS